MSRHDKIKEEQIQLDDLDNYKPLEQPMVEDTAKKAQQIISEPYQRNLFDSVTKKWLLQTLETAMGTEMAAAALANIFMCVVETDILSENNTKPLERKRYIDDVFSLWDTDREEIDK